MWGVLIFLKFNYVVGVAGVLHALVAVFVSYIAALCTTICVSAIASSGGVASEGGPYYMISRSLGPYIGVSVGITYFIGITFLGAMEAVGAVEAFQLLAPDIFSFSGAVQAFGSIIVIVLALFVYGGINLVTKLGVVFGLVVFLTIGVYYASLGLAPLSSHDPSSYVTGLSWDTFTTNWGPMYPNGTGFGTAMSLFFPCFTGILSGADRSDVLRDPPRNILYGTMGAITFSFFMYSAFMILWGSVAEACYLRGDCPSASATVAARRLSSEGSAQVADESIADQILWPNKYVVLIGVIISCCSQTLQCMICAPRILKAIAADHLIPWLRPLGEVSARGEPARALLVTYILSAGLVMIGSVDVLAPMVTISFLVCYGFLNVSCMVLTSLKTPTWRPFGIFQLRWRIFYIVSALIGFVGCIAISVIVSKYWTIGVMVFALLLYWYVARSGEEVEWGSGMDGLRYGLALSALTGLKREQQRKINWRPQLLALLPLDKHKETVGSGDAKSASLHSQMATTDASLHGEDCSPITRNSHYDVMLLQFCGQLRKGRGMCVIAGIIDNCTDDRTKEDSNRLREERTRLDQLMDANALNGFSEVVTAPTWVEGAKYVCQLSGLGGLRPNTLVLSWPHNWRQEPQVAVDFLKIVSLALMEDKAVVCPKNLSKMPLGDNAIEQEGHMDLWWFITDGGLLVLLTWLLAQHKIWRKCTVRVFLVVENVSQDMADTAAETVRQLFKQKRILANNVIVEAVILSDVMLRPYTYDYTLKVGQRRNLAAGVAEQQSAVIPHTLEELFSDQKHDDVQIVQEMSVDMTDDEKAEGGNMQNPTKSRLRRMFSKALHPRGHKRKVTFDDNAKSAEKESPNGTSPKHRTSLASLFARPSSPGVVTEANEKDLLDTLDERCRQRRQHLEEQRVSEIPFGDKDEENDGIDEDNSEDVSVIAELPKMIPSQSNVSSSSAPLKPSAMFERLNQMILEKSKDSSLVLLNLPDLWGTSQEDAAAYMAFCDCLVKGIDRVIFVHSSGTEVVRIF